MRFCDHKDIVPFDEVWLRVQGVSDTYAAYTEQTYSVTFPALGKNLFDVDTVGFTQEKYINYQTGEMVSWGSSWNATGYVPILQNTTYTLTVKANGTDLAGIAFYNLSEEYISGITTKDTTTNITFTTPENACYLRFSAVSPSENPCQLELGSTATSYEPYTNTNTAYGGTLDAVAGTLSVEWANISSYNGEELPGEWISSMDIYSAGTTPTTGAQVVYALATPLSFTIDPVTVTTLIGTNTIWTDTNGTNTIKY